LLRASETFEDLKYAVCLGIDMVRALKLAFIELDWRMDLQSTVRVLKYRSFQLVLAAKLLKCGSKRPPVDPSVSPQSARSSMDETQERSTPLKASIGPLY
jgi:hypothetical protein